MQRKIGILAGMGPSSTAPFLDLVVAECRSQYGAHDDIDFPKMMICSQPAPFFHDRPIDHSALQAATIEGLRDLDRCGVDLIAIACNSVHIYYPALAASVAAPVLNIVEIAYDALPATARRVAVAASRPLAESGLYQDAGRARGFEIVEPGWQNEIDDLMEMVKAETLPEAFQAKWAEMFAHLGGLGVDATIVACLDLSGAFRHARTPVFTIDAAQALAARAVAGWRALTSADAASAAARA